MSKPLIWMSILAMKLACTPVWAGVQQEDLIGCWSAAYEYDSVKNSDGGTTGNARLCSREPTAGGCGGRAYLAVTYCFDRKGAAYGAESHCWSTKKGPICHGSDGLSGSYHLQDNRMNFFSLAEEGDEAEERKKDDTRALAWSCSLSISSHPDVIEFSDCAQTMKAFFRDCDLSQKGGEYQTNRCEVQK